MQSGYFVSDNEMNAYVDGSLDPSRRLAVATFLATHPREAARAEAFRAQREGLQALFDHVLDQPAPDRLRAVVARHAARAGRRRMAWIVAASGLAFTLGLGGYALRARLTLDHESPLTTATPAPPRLQVKPELMKLPRANAVSHFGI